MFVNEDPFVGYTVILFVTFVFVMTIIMMNLITGLALDDIQKIAENAEFQNLSMQVYLSIHSRRIYGSYFQVELVLGLERLYKSIMFFGSKEKFKFKEKTYTITKEAAPSIPFFQGYLSREYIISLIMDQIDDSGTHV